MDVQGATESVAYLQLIALVVLGMLSYFLKRSLNDLESVEKEVKLLRRQVDIILYRDRSKRLEDYDRERRLSEGEEEG